jgi:hypothetical protein
MKVSRWGVWLAVVAGCAAVESRDVAEPRPLRGAALEWARAALERNRVVEEDGDVTASHGERVPYSRYCLIGSALGEDRGLAFAEFAAELLARGCEYRSLEEGAGGYVTKLLVVADGERVVFSYLRW